SMCIGVNGPGVSAIAAYTRADGTYTTMPLRDGSYTVSFSDCTADPSYGVTWYGGPSQATATPVGVVQAATLSGVDAVMSLAAKNDAAVASLEVLPAKDPDGADSPTRRVVRVVVSNAGPADARSVDLHVFARTASDDGYIPLGGGRFDVPAGSAVERTFTRDLTGVVGDVEVTAEISVARDEDLTNNAMSMPSWVTAPGTGAGVGYPVAYVGACAVAICVFGDGTVQTYPPLP
ncbi:MAG: hypothetical protein LC750_02930, partial [Actinobacteria bacterium]|nr:hypothetical protein [Actinomycetota bacterium]